MILLDARRSFKSNVKLVQFYVYGVTERSIYKLYVDDIQRNVYPGDNRKKAGCFSQTLRSAKKDNVIVPCFNHNMMSQAKEMLS